MYRGAITENYIAMELVQRGHTLYFWETNSNSEVDFVATIDGAVFPKIFAIILLQGRSLTNAT
jgi:predicted AAA+ superfamily ATPase